MKLTIEKMVYGGDGLAHLPPDASGRGKTAFVPFVLPGEEVEASVEEERPGFIRAKTEQIIIASPQRIEAPCPYFQRCGGCHYQHTSYENQLEIKSQILRETLLRTAKIEWNSEIRTLASPPWNYRNRTRMKLQHASFALGYYKFNSHELLPVEECPISSPLINRAVKVIWELGRANALDKSIAEIEFFANAADDKLLIEIHISGKGNDSLLEKSAANFFKSISAELPDLVGVAAFFQGPAAQSFGYEGLDSLQYKTGVADFRVSAGSFFQVNRFLIDDLVRTATAGASGKLAWDLYAGVGLFSAALARTFERVIAVEAGTASSDDLKHNAPRHVKAIQATTEAFLNSKGKRPKPDFILVDPPRAGLGQAVAKRLAATEAGDIAYVSCDPATLARDLRVLLDSGYRIEHIDLADLFPQTFHIESIVRLSR
jgi:23S rRNA (uracil1939-C5)-methyltransferase